MIYLAVMLHKRRSLHAQEQEGMVNYLLLTSVAMADSLHSGSDLDCKTKDATAEKQELTGSTFGRGVSKSSSLIITGRPTT